MDNYQPVFGSIAAIILGVGVGILIFFALRWVVLWYWQLHRIVRLLEVIAKIDHDTPTKEIGIKSSS